MPRYALLIAYDGTGFAGWWRQPSRRTAAGELDGALDRIGEPRARPLGASRTDAGVHARGQVALITTGRAWQPGELHAALCQQLPDDLSCRAIAQVGDAWHPCHQARSKTYSYRIDDGAVADPFIARFAWRPPFRLDLGALQQAAAGLPGERDWRGFVRRGETRAPSGGLVRLVTAVSWRAEGTVLLCSISGEGFIFRLVRSLVGAMVAVAHGSCSGPELASALAGADSPAGRQQAPARGLCLEQVDYDPPLAWHAPG
jgi:tRNA pseudouridine38-40 synthase